MSKLPASHLWPGVPMALSSATLFGASAPLAKLLLGSVPPQILAGLLYLGGVRIQNKRSCIDANFLDKNHALFALS